MLRGLHLDGCHLDPSDAVSACFQTRKPAAD